MNRVVLLGASNLTYGFPLVAESLRTTLGEVDLLAAHGHGRAYGRWSRVLGRRLPGIIECGLWESLATNGNNTGTTLGLITDVGNDLLYGSQPETILGWVGECVTRLSDAGAAVAITGVPLESVKRMSAPRYHATRICFFPSSGPAWPTMQRMADELDAGLREIAASHSATFVAPRLGWYGVDPIHVRRTRRVAAWNEILSTWPIQELAMTRPGFGRATSLWRLRPALREMYGREQRTGQPVLSDNGMSVWLY